MEAQDTHILHHTPSMYLIRPNAAQPRTLILESVRREWAGEVGVAA
jgi:hypothetical protein